MPKPKKNPPRVDIGIATYGMAAYEWWGTFFPNLLAENGNGFEIGMVRAVSSALSDHNKNKLIDDRRSADSVMGIARANEKGRNERTDANKSTIAQGFLAGDSDYLFMVDDDTVPPKFAIRQLIAAGHPFIGGLAFLPVQPFNPIAYMRNDKGFYMSLWEYAHGALIQLDSIGMACTLIHRSVFEKIKAEHILFQRPTGSLFAVHREAVSGSTNGNLRARTIVEDGLLKMPVEQVEEDERAFPFFAMEYGRTEDHHFAELAESCGFKPYLDTTVVCDHFKLKGVNATAHRQMLERMPVRYARKENPQAT